MTVPARPSLSRQPLLLALALLPALTSCALATEPAATVPARWQATPALAGALDSTALAQWWTRFNDPVLNQLVADAFVHNPDLRTALSAIAAARATGNIERAGLFPTVDATAGATGTRTQARRTGTTSDTDYYTAGISTSWELDLFGKQRLALAAARADLAQTTEDYHAAQVSLAAEVATAYVTLRSTEAQLAALETSVAAQSETTQITQWREQAGLASTLDAQESVSTLEQSRASLPALRQTLTETRNELATLCGHAPGELDTLLASTKALPAVPAALAVGIPAETLRQRPDVRAAERGVDAAVARTKSAKRDRLPSLSLTGSIGVESLKAGEIFSPQYTISKLVGSLTAPIFSAGSIKATIEIKTEAERQALIAYESTVLTALAEVENAQSSVARTTERLDSIRIAAAAARDAATLAAQEYQAGQSDLLTLLDAQRSSLSLDQQEVSAGAAQLAAYIQLYKSLGGGWSTSTL